MMMHKLFTFYSSAERLLFPCVTEVIREEGWGVSYSLFGFFHALQHLNCTHSCTTIGHLVCEAVNETVNWFCWDRTRAQSVHSHYLCCFILNKLRMFNFTHIPLNVVAAELVAVLPPLPSASLQPRSEAASWEPSSLRK